MKLIFRLIFLLVVSTAWGQSPHFTPPPNRNAALRYWMAFGSMQDHPADPAMSKLIDDVLSGSSTWDEQRLGTIVQENEAAVLEMQRASNLPECNWGLEYAQGDNMSIGHLPKARAMARLNALYGARQMAKGDINGAVTSWLAGLRFAQCVASDVGLIGVLSAKPAFMADLEFLIQATRSGALSPELREKVSTQLKQLPSDGLDWASSIAAEAWANDQGLRYLSKAQNFQETYKAFYNSPPPQPAHPPTEAEIAEFNGLMNDIEAAFRLPYTPAQDRLKNLLQRTEKMNPAVLSALPNYQRVNDNRHQVALEKENLMKALGNK